MKLRTVYVVLYSVTALIYRMTCFTKMNKSFSNEHRSTYRLLCVARMRSVHITRLTSPPLISTDLILSESKAQPWRTGTLHAAHDPVRAMAGTDHRFSSDEMRSAEMR